MRSRSDASPRVLTVPGLDGSGPQHWQSRWEARHGFIRVEQDDWAQPSRSAWVERLVSVLEREPEPVVLAAHSLGCAVIAHAARRIAAKVAGALLVAPADVDDPARTPERLRSFSPLPDAPLGFPGIVIASRDDPFVTLERARALAAGWQVSFVDGGALGHINAESGLGDWPEGYRLLQALRT